MPDFYPSVSKRILTELTEFRHLFGNTKYESSFSDTEDATNRTLFLGFTDLHNAWATIGSAASSKSPPKQLQIDLVDPQLVIVARGVLLDHLAMAINLNTEEDVLFLWAICYCTVMPSAWQVRLRQEITVLLAKPNFDASFGRKEDATAVRRVLEAWVSDTAKKLKPKPIISSRFDYLERWLGWKPGSGATYPETPITTLPFGKQLGHYSGVICTNALDGIIADAELQLEVYQYLTSGWVFTEKFEAHFQQAVEDNGESARAVNPTMLDPFTWKWELHYSCCPFLSYIPFSEKALDFAASQAFAGNSRPLTEACLVDLTSLLKERQKCAAVLTFWCADPLHLVTYDTFPADSFSSIDTSTLADKAGLLNVLVLCQPLLRRHLKATLRTRSVTWSTSTARNLKQYLKLSLGADLKFIPTLLGVRLLNDPEFGREAPRRLNINCYLEPDVFIWAPVLLEATLMSRLSPEGSLSDQDSLLAGLRQLARVCISPGTGCETGVARKQIVGETETCGLRLSTSFTLLWVLRGLTDRCPGVVPTTVWMPDEGEVVSEPSWKIAATYLKGICAIPKDAWLQWDALCCWCFGEREENGKVGHGGSGETPVVVQHKFKLSDSYKKRLSSSRYDHHNPIFVAELATNAALQKAMMTVAFSDNQGATLDIEEMQQLDCIGFDLPSRTAFLLLPNSSTSDYLALRDISAADSINSRIVSAAMNQLGAVDVVKAFNLPPPRRLMGDQWKVASMRTLLFSSTYGEGFECFTVRKLYERVADYRLELGIVWEPKKRSTFSVISTDSSSTKPPISLEFDCDGVDPDKGGCSHKVVLKSHEEGVKEGFVLRWLWAKASVHLNWPVEYTGHKVILKRDAKGFPESVMLTLPKSDYWPEDLIVLPRVSVQNLCQSDLSQVQMTAMKMYNEPEIKAKEAASEGKGLLDGAFLLQNNAERTYFFLKDAILTIFLVTINVGAGKLVHSLMDEGDEERTEPSMTLIVHSMGYSPEGRLLAHVSYIDHDIAWNLYPPGELRKGVERRFVDIITTSMDTAEPPDTNSLKCSPGVIPELRKLLKRNAQRLDVPAWQKKLLNNSPEWEASFIAPLFSNEHTKEEDEIATREAILEMKEQERMKETSRPGGLGSAGVQKNVPSTTTKTSQKRSQALNGNSKWKERAIEGPSGDLCTCAVCGKKGGIMMRCSRCKNVVYCDRACQVKDWRTHKLKCQGSG